MSYKDRNYHEISVRLNFPSIKSMHTVNDYIFIWKIINKQINWPDVFNLYTSRTIVYDLRFIKPMFESITTLNYIYFSTIFRLRRFWNLLHSDIRNIKELDSFQAII